MRSPEFQELTRFNRPLVLLIVAVLFFATIGITTSNSTNKTSVDGSVDTTEKTAAIFPVLDNDDIVTKLSVERASQGYTLISQNTDLNSAAQEAASLIVANNNSAANLDIYSLIKKHNYTHNGAVWYSVTLSPTDDEGDLLAAYFETMKSNKDLQSVYADIGIGSAMSSDKAYRTVVFFLAKPQITSSSQPTSTTSTAQPYSSSKPNDNKKCHEINNRYNVLMSSLRFTKPSSSSYFNAMGTSDSYYEKYSYNIAATEYNAILDSYKSQYESEIRSVDCSSALILSPFNYSDSVTIFN